MGMDNASEVLQIFPIIAYDENTVNLETAMLMKVNAPPVVIVYGIGSFVWGKTAGETMLRCVKLEGFCQSVLEKQN